MYPFTLSGQKAGITRLRFKGGASPDSFWDLVNAYINTSSDIVPRGGTRVVATLPGTIGLAVHDGLRHVFTSDPDFVAGAPEGYVVHLLLHESDQSLQLKRIHFAEPLMGFLYVTAEFENGDISDYWLTEGSTGGDAWQANTTYRVKQIVRPTVPNGFYYSANRLNPPAPTWKPDVLRAVGDKVEPTVFNGFEYVVLETFGATPKSGRVEPNWPTVEGAVVFEDTDLLPGGDGGSGDGTQLPPGIDDRYPPQGGGGFSDGSGTNTVIQ